MQAATKTQPEASLEFLTGPLSGVTLHVAGAAITLGRGVGNDVVLTDPTVSRTHARLAFAWAEGAWHIENLSHTSSVTVEARDIEQAALNDGCTIGLGPETSFRFRCAPARPPANVVATASAAASESLESTRADPRARTAPAASPSPRPPVAVAPRAHGGGEAANLGATMVAPPPEPGAPTLEITDHTRNARAVYTLVKETVSVGRAATNDIIVDVACVSDWHLQLVRHGKRWELIHPHPHGDSKHGLLFENRQIGGREAFRRRLVNGDSFRIGDEHGALVTLTFRAGAAASQPVALRMQRIPLAGTEVSIGRLRDNALVLDHPQVSAHHARLTREQGTYRLTDLGSTNHTYVNGGAVSSHLLLPDDEIRIGPYKLVYGPGLLTLYDESGGVRIDALNLTQVGSNQAVLLDDISLCIPPRSFVALVGASGAGKSTLLDALSGLRPAREGSVYYNGQEFYSHRAAFSRQIGYVPQDEIIHRDLSVERALFYAAKLRLPSDFTEEQIGQRIEQVLEEVEIGHRRELLVRDLSGGQRKRVSIALELLADPSLFFLDEPTSGLDPGLDRRMMLLLRKLADRGHTIVLVTHATNNINVCDYVCFLAQGGRLAYFGPPEEAGEYFHQGDFAEIYSALEPRGERPALPVEVRDQFLRSPEYAHYVAEPLSERPLAAAGGAQSAQATGARVAVAQLSTVWRQFALLSTRYVELLWNDKKNLAILLLQAPVIAFMLAIFIAELNDGGMFRSPVSPLKQADAQKFLFIMAFSAVMFGCINAAREIVKEAPIYRRERTVNLRIAPYLFSKIAVLGVLCLAQCLVLVLIVMAAAPLHGGVVFGAFWEVYIALSLTALCGLMLGLTISALVPNNDQAMSFIPLVLIPQVVFSGAIFPLKQIVLQLVGVAFVARWAMASLGSTMGLDGNLLGGDRLFGSCAACLTYRHSDAHYLLLTWGVPLAMVIVLAGLTAYLLRRKDVSR